MIDQASRNNLRTVVNEYLSDRITSFQFDERLNAISDRTDDETVREIVGTMWFFYDDIQDHKVRLGKGEWDLIQRLLLIAECGAEFRRNVEATCWSDHDSQPVAAMTLVFTPVLVVLLSIVAGPYILPALLLTLGSISIYLNAWRERTEFDMEREQDPNRAWPFNSVAQVRAALRRAPTFRKRRYPSHLNQRRPWIVGNYVNMLPWWLIWCLVSPLALLIQCFPMRVASSDSGQVVLH